MLLDITKQIEILKTINIDTHSTYKQKSCVASLTNLPQQDKDFLKSKSCIVSISVGGKAHEGEKFSATLSMVNARFKKCLIVVGDTLQRHTLAISSNKQNSFELYALAKRHGDEWLQRNMQTITNELHIPYQIVRWDHWLNSDKFSNNFAKTRKLYDTNALFRRSIHQVIEKFMHRHVQRSSAIIKNNIADHSINYLLEECACMLQWFDEGYEYEVYPSKRIQALSYFFETAEPTRSLRLMQSAQVRFDKAPVSITQDMNQTINSILKLMPGHVYWKNKHGVYLGCNLQQAQSYRLNDINELLGKSDFDIFDYDVAYGIRQNDLDVMRSGKLLVVEESAEILGQYSTFLSYKIPLKDSNSNVVGILGVSLDITKQKEAERQLSEKNHLLTEALRAKQDFLHNISHEIKTPMSCILKMSNLLYEDWEKYPNNEARKAHLKMAVESNNRLQSVLLNLLDLSKVNAGKMQYDKKSYSLKQSAKDVISEFIDQQYRIHLICHDKDKNDFIGIYDHFRIEQVIRNLLANAISYAKTGDITITISSKDGFLVFEIIDQGIGVPEDELQYIFQIFTQSSRTTTCVGGTGIGLSISKTIIADHGGSIVAMNNKNGIGSHFSFKLPVDSSTSLSKSDDSSLTNDVFIERQNKSEKPTLLVIDDDVSILQVSELIFNKMGFKTILANSGASGLEMLQNFSEIIDVVLLDMMMPDIHGLKVLRKIKADSKLCKTPVYMYTGISNKDETDKAIKIGACGSIDKTSSSEKIVGVLSKFLKIE